MMAKPRCPRCDRIGVAQADLWWCQHCKALFDDEPLEGGTALHHDPVRNAEMKEREEQRRKERRR